MIPPDNPYTKMQREVYAKLAAEPTAGDGRDPVVGAWDALNGWKDFELLFDGIDTTDMTALDYGCGPGRSLRLYKDRFLLLDGADIDPLNLDRAMVRLPSCSNLTCCNGVDLVGVPDNFYDLVYSTICLQHIPVWNIRQQLFTEFRRVLKPGGWFTAQMGFGVTDDPRAVPYLEDRWDAPVTNGGCDVKVTSLDYLLNDLQASGFDPDTFRACVRKTGPGDWHPHWVFFRAAKGK